MANRNFHKNQYSSEVDPVTLWFKITGAADVEANGFTINRGSGYVTSISRSGEGQITVTLDEKYDAFLGLILAGTTEEDVNLHLVSEDVDGVKTVVFETYVAGSAADLDSESLNFALVLRNSSVGD